MKKGFLAVAAIRLALAAAAAIGLRTAGAQPDDSAPPAPPDPRLLDLQALKQVGLSDAARQNARLINALTEAMRRHDEDMQRPTGATPPLNADLMKMLDLRPDGEGPFDKVEAMAEDLLKKYTAPREQGLICAAVAKIHGESGSDPRTIDWARKALECPLEPRLKLRMYVFWGDSDYLKNWRQVRGGSAPAVRQAALPYLLGLQEALGYSLPETKPELSGVQKVTDGSRDPALERKHRLQVQARVVSMFISDMVEMRDTLIGQLAGLGILAPASAKNKLRGALKDPNLVDYLLAAARAGKDLQAEVKSYLEGRPATAPSGAPPAAGRSQAPPAPPAASGRAGADRP